MKKAVTLLFFLCVPNLSQLRPEMSAWKSIIKDFHRQSFAYYSCLLYTSPSPRDQRGSRMPSSA